MSTHPLVPRQIDPSTLLRTRSRPPENRSALAWPRYKSRNVAGAVSDKRHSGAIQRREDNLAPLALRQRLASLGVDDFKVEVGLAQMVSHVRIAIQASAKAHLGHAVMLKNLGARLAPQSAHKALRYVIAAKDDGTQPAASRSRQLCSRSSASASICTGRPMKHGRLSFIHASESCAGIDRKTMQDRNDARACDALG